MKKQDALRLVFIAASLCLLIVVIVQLFPLIREVITHTDDEREVVAYVQAYGTRRGAAVLVGLAALQYILPVIPAPALGVLIGLSYGAFWGPLIFLAGCALGNLFVFFSARQLSGMTIPHIRRTTKHKTFLPQEQLEKMKRPEIVVFLCLLIPGMPNAALPYLVAKTRISLAKYMAASLLGGAPSAVIYTLLGKYLSRGNHMAAIAMGAFILVTILILLLFRQKIMDKIIQQGNA